MNLEAVKTILSKEITFKSDSQRYTFYKKIKNDPNHDDFTVQLAYALVLYDTTYKFHMEKLKEKDIELERLTRENDEYMENELLNEQKELLTYYIASFADNALELKIFLNEEFEIIEKLFAISDGANKSRKNLLRYKS